MLRAPRLAAIHDALDPNRGDPDAYVGMAEESGARRVLDIGCGTGVFALAPSRPTAVGSTSGAPVMQDAVTSAFTW